MSRNLIAILRGVKPEEVEAIADVIVASGITRVEVPLNSPNPLVSIAKLVARFGDDVLIGAGTVLSAEDVAAVADVGGKLVVSPDCNEAVIRETKKRGMQSFPGVITPTECFSAIRSGADGLKLFPATLVGFDGIAAMRAVLPKDLKVYAVGGADPSSFALWKKAGVDGFGIGSAIYKAGDTPAVVSAKAKAIVEGYDAAYGK